MASDGDTEPTFYVSPDGNPRWYKKEERKALRFQEAIDKAKPGDTIELLPGVYEDTVVIDGIEAAGKPITIRGSSRTTLDGRRNPVRPPGIPNADRYAFFKIQNSSGIVIENMTIQNAWPTAIYIENSQHIVVRQLNLNGATYGIVARGAATEHLLVERCSWIQDERIWQDVNWYDIHEEPMPRKELDGDFFRAFEITGHVVIRYNFIAQAFNGVHFFACPPKLNKIKKTDGMSDEAWKKAQLAEIERAKDAVKQFSRNVWIYRNTFIFIRDNAVEAEYAATNWWVFENRIYNCHKWFAFERSVGGYIYIFANRGWFDRLPGPPGDCHTGGAVFKATKAKKRSHEILRLPDHPVYVFHNSWYLRSAYIKKGALKHFHHFNNAIEYARVAYHPPGVVQPDRKMIGVGRPDPQCDGPADPQEPFTTEWERLDITFDNDVCLHPDYPDTLRDQGYPVRGLGLSPQFPDARYGYFDLSETSPCLGRGKSFEIKLISDATWTLPDRLNVGAMALKKRDGEEVWLPYTPFELGCPTEDVMPDDYVDDQKPFDRKECAGR